MNFLFVEDTRFTIANSLWVGEGTIVFTSDLTGAFNGQIEAAVSLFHKDILYVTEKEGAYFLNFLRLETAYLPNVIFERKGIPTKKVRSI